MSSQQDSVSFPASNYLLNSLTEASIDHESSTSNLYKHIQIIIDQPILIVSCIEFNLRNYISLNMEISSSDSDNEDQPNHQPLHQHPHETDSVNRTAANSKIAEFPFTQNEALFEQISQHFLKFYETELIRERIEPHQLFENNDHIFGRFGHKLVYYPTPNLYFLPITILFQNRVNMLELQQSIIREYGERANVSKLPIRNSKSKYWLEITIHNQRSLSYYNIKNVQVDLKTSEKHQCPECLDEELVLNRLFEFYDRNYEQHQRFSTLCGLLLYWAFQRGLLKPDYFHVNVLKLLVLYYCIAMNHCPNIIQIYLQGKQRVLQQIKKRYVINKHLECELDRELFDEYNFMISQKKGFYIESKRKYSLIKSINPIPFPVSENDIKIYSQKQNKRKIKKKHVQACHQFASIMNYLNSHIQRGDGFSIDFRTKKIYEKKYGSDFDLEIMHPVLGYNMCEDITDNHSKIRKIKYEIGSVVNSLKESDDCVESFARIFDKV